MDELLELEHKGWQSLCSSLAADFYGQLMTENGVKILSPGLSSLANRSSSR